MSMKQILVMMAVVALVFPLSLELKEIFRRKIFSHTSKICET